MDYGREPSFGVFITPWAAEPQQTVELAVHAERVGLDLVTFQDHPYQPRFLDAWTLLSYVAARTERVTLAATSSICRCACPPCSRHRSRASTG